MGSEDRSQKTSLAMHRLKMDTDFSRDPQPHFLQGGKHPYVWHTGREVVGRGNESRKKKVTATEVSFTPGPGQWHTWAHMHTHTRPPRAEFCHLHLCFWPMSEKKKELVVEAAPGHGRENNLADG